MYGVSRGSRWRGGHIRRGVRSLGPGGRGREEARLVLGMRSGRRMHRVYRGVSFDAQRFPANAAFLNASLEGGKGSVVVVKSGCDLGLVLDEDVVLLEVLVVGQLYGGGGRLSLSGLYALLQLMEGHFQHLPLGVSRKGVPEGGESAQVRRRGRRARRRPGNWGAGSARGHGLDEQLHGEGVVPREKPSSNRSQPWLGERWAAPRKSL